MNGVPPPVKGHFCRKLGDNVRTHNHNGHERKAYEVFEALVNRKKGRGFLNHRFDACSEHDHKQDGV